MKKRWLILGGVILAAAVAYFFKSQLVVAMVNGQPIWRTRYIREMERQVGKRTLEGLVTETLVLQAAKEKGIKIADEEVEGEIKKIEESLAQQGQQLDQVLAFQGISREDLRRQIRLQKIAAKAVGEIKISDQELDDYLQGQNIARPEGIEEGQWRDQVRQQLVQQRQNQKIQEWLVELKDKASIRYF